MQLKSLCLSCLCALAGFASSTVAETVDTGAFDPLYYANSWTGRCQSGQYQTPINIPFRTNDPAVPEIMITDIQMPTIQNPNVTNTGSALKVEWDIETMTNDTLPVVRGGGNNISHVLLTPEAEAPLQMTVTPIQFHFHAVSEHALDGLLFPVELHIVTLISEGQAPPEWGCDAIWNGGAPVLENCTAVFAILYKLGESTPPHIDVFLDTMPSVAGVTKQLPMEEFNMNMLLPEDHSYYTYYGSLTTPQCNEGLRWHVLSNPVTITHDTLTRFKTQMSNTVNQEKPDEILGFRTNNRYLQALNGRTVYYHKDPLTPQEAIQGSEVVGDDGSDQSPAAQAERAANATAANAAPVLAGSVLSVFVGLVALLLAVAV